MLLTAQVEFYSRGGYDLIKPRQVKWTEAQPTGNDTLTNNLLEANILNFDRP